MVYLHSYFGLGESIEVGKHCEPHWIHIRIVIVTYAAACGLAGRDQQECIRVPSCSYLCVFYITSKHSDTR